MPTVCAGTPRVYQLFRDPLVIEVPLLEAYAKASLKKYRPMAARNEDKKVFSGLL
jgi:hypothetical protein